MKSVAALILAGSVSLLVGCGHTIQGMKQDIHEGTASNPPQTKTVVVKKTRVIYSPQSSQALPNSPPPLETPSQ